MLTLPLPIPPLRPQGLHTLVQLADLASLKLDGESSSACLPGGLVCGTHAGLAACVPVVIVPFLPVITVGAEPLPMRDVRVCRCAFPVSLPACPLLSWVPSLLTRGDVRVGVIVAGVRQSVWCRERRLRVRRSERVREERCS